MALLFLIYCAARQKESDTSLLLWTDGSQT